MKSNFGPYFIKLAVIILGYTVNVVFSQAPVHIDIENDLQRNGNWEVICNSGYQDYTWQFRCPALGEGTVDLPDEDLRSGQIGFWTMCEDHCLIKYNVQLGDTKFSARMYQRNNIFTKVSINGTAWYEIPGEGWVDMSWDLSTGEIWDITLEFEHISPEHFALLDRMAVNDDLPPLPPREVPTDEPGTTTPFPEEPTTIEDSETTPKDPEMTTEGPETTPKDPEMTTESPETTPKDPEMTTESPETTPKDPEMTTENPETTPTDPEMTTEDPVWTSDPITETTTVRDPSTIHIDVEADIPTNGNWDVDCPAGYREQVSEFDCINSGTVDIPREDLSGQIGFWTTCAIRCGIRYNVQAGDTKFSARVYQMNLMTEISFDGVTWEYYPGEGWVDIEKDLRGVDFISMRFDHLDPTYFVILDKIAINGDLPPLLTSTVNRARMMESSFVNVTNKKMAHYQKLLDSYKLIQQRN